MSQSVSYTVYLSPKDGYGCHDGNEGGHGGLGGHGGQGRHGVGHSGGRGK